MAIYFDRFGTKACCFDDLLPYIDALSPQELASLRSTLSAATDVSLTVRRMDSVCARDRSLTGCPRTQDIRIATKAINAWKLLRRYAPPGSAGEEHEAALAFTRLYFEALPLGEPGFREVGTLVCPGADRPPPRSTGANLPPTELQPADDFALLAGQAWVAAYQTSRVYSSGTTSLSRSD